MRSARYSHIDEDIEPQRIRSRFLRELIGIYDTYLVAEDPLDLMLVDPAKKFFVTVSDKTILFRHKKHPENFVFLPYVRMIYVVRHHRGKGVQRGLLEEFKTISDDVGESFAICADPFVLNGTDREMDAHQAMVKLWNRGEQPTEHWLKDLEKQRQRFFSAGLHNIQFGNAQVTEPFQQFVYPSKNEDICNLNVFAQHECHYTVDYEKLEQLG